MVLPELAVAEVEHASPVSHRLDLDPGLVRHTRAFQREQSQLQVVIHAVQSHALPAAQRTVCDSNRLRAVLERSRRETVPGGQARASCWRLDRVEGKHGEDEREQRARDAARGQTRNVRSRQRLRVDTEIADEAVEAVGRIEGGSPDIVGAARFDALVPHIPRGRKRSVQVQPAIAAIHSGHHMHPLVHGKSPRGSDRPCSTVAEAHRARGKVVVGVKAQPLILEAHDVVVDVGHASLRGAAAPQVEDLGLLAVLVELVRKRLDPQLVRHVSPVVGHLGQRDEVVALPATLQPHRLSTAASTLVADVHPLCSTTHPARRPHIPRRAARQFAVADGEGKQWQHVADQCLGHRPCAEGCDLYRIQRTAVHPDVADLAPPAPAQRGVLAHRVGSALCDWDSVHLVLRDSQPVDVDCGGAPADRGRDMHPLLERERIGADHPFGAL
eukprot:815250-Rhodomonas_salina.1